MTPFKVSYLGEPGESQAQTDHTVSCGVDEERRKACVLRVHVGKFLERCALILAIKGASESVIESFTVQMSKHLTEGDYTNFVSQAKSFCCYGRAKLLGNKLPGFRLVFTGRWRQWYNRRVCRNTRKHRNLFNSLWNLKNVALPLDNSEVKSELVKHYQGVEEFVDATPEQVGALVATLEPILEIVNKRVLKKLASDEEAFFVLEDAFAEHAAANKASFVSTSSDKGEVGELVRSCFSLFGERSCPLPTTHPIQRTYHSLRAVWDERIPWQAKILSGMKKHERKRALNDMERSWYFGGYLRLRESRLEQWYKSAQREVWIELVLAGLDADGFSYASFAGDDDEEQDDEDSPDVTDFDIHLWQVEFQEEPHLERTEVIVDPVDFDCQPTYFYKYPRSQELWSTFIIREAKLFSEEYTPGEIVVPSGAWTNEDLLDGGLVNYPAVRVVPICEPLKVRVITVGAAISKYLGTWWQKRVHGALRKVPGFELLGRSAGTSDVEAVYDKSFDRGRGRECLFSSGDFKGASNGIPLRLGQALVARLSRGLPDWYIRAMLICAGPHIMVYADKWGITPKLQYTGNLMGEKYSFPVLSLVVHGCFLLASRLCGDDRPLLALSASGRTNGDDSLFYGRPALIRMFWKVTEDFNFTESVGKSYEHGHYANINSQNYWHDGAWAHRERGLFCGLVVGQKKLATDVFNPTEVITEILESCIDAREEHRVLKLFLRLHAKSIAAWAGGRNLFVSPALGGLGQRTPNPYFDGTRTVHWASRVSKPQRELAQMRLEADPYVHASSRGLFPALTKIVADRHPWDVEGLPTYWGEQRAAKMEDYGVGHTAESVHDLKTSLLERLVLSGLRPVQDLVGPPRLLPVKQMHLRYSRLDVKRNGTPVVGLSDEDEPGWTSRCSVCGENEWSEPFRGVTCPICLSETGWVLKADEYPKFPEVYRKVRQVLTPYSVFDKMRFRSDPLQAVPLPRSRVVLHGPDQLILGIRSRL